MYTADPTSPLGYWCRKVGAMKAGERLEVSMVALEDIPTFEHNNAVFGPADRILGNIVGSAYTHSFRVNPSEWTVTFFCHDDTGERRYIAPDRR